MARKLSEEQAISMIVRGFLNVEIEELSENLKRQLTMLWNRLAKKDIKITHMTR